MDSSMKVAYRSWQHIKLCSPVGHGDCPWRHAHFLCVTAPSQKLLGLTIHSGNGPWDTCCMASRTVLPTYSTCTQQTAEAEAAGAFPPTSLQHCCQLLEVSQPETADLFRYMRLKFLKSFWMSLVWRNTTADNALKKQNPQNWHFRSCCFAWSILPENLGFYLFCMGIVLEFSFQDFNI